MYLCLNPSKADRCNPLKTQWNTLTLLGAPQDEETEENIESDKGGSTQEKSFSDEEMNQGNLNQNFFWYYLLYLVVLFMIPYFVRNFMKSAASSKSSKFRVLFVSTFKATSSKLFG